MELGVLADHAGRGGCLLTLVHRTVWQTRHGAPEPRGLRAAL